LDDVSQNPFAFDAHTHLDFPAFDEDRAEVVARARAAGVHRWVIAGADPAHWDRIDKVCAHTGGTACHGVHPWWVSELDDRALEDRLRNLETRMTAGIGETGLDWHRATTAVARGRQEASFRSHCTLARRRRLPLILHCVRAYPELLAILKESGKTLGMIHSWSGPEACVQPALDLGLYLSFGASVTRSAKVRAAARAVPADRLLLETDCPDQPLRRGERGEPHHLIEIAEHVAKLRHCDPSDLLRQTSENANQLFGPRP